MHWVDVVLGLVIAGSIVGGFARGLVLQMGTVIGLVVGIIVARTNYRTATDFLALFVHRDEHLATVAFFVVVLLVWTLVIMLAEIVRTAVRFTPLGMIDRIGGAVIGLVIGIAIADLMVALALRSHDPSLIHSLHGSQIASVLKDITPNLWGLVPPKLLPK